LLVRSSAAALLSLLLLLAGGAATAGAHGESSPTIQTLVDEVDPGVEGLEFRVVRGRSARLAALNRTGQDLVILGRGDRPFLRIGPRGVYADVNSLDWYRSGNPDGIATPPPEARIGGPPRFEPVVARSSFAWFDHRLHPGTVRVPREALEAQRTARLDDWTVPARLGDEQLEVRGHVEYRPLLGAVGAELLSSSEPLPGVQVTLLQGPLPGFFLLNLGDRPVTVIGKEGEPFVRIGPRGVEVNLRSPTHLDDQFARGETPPVSADAGAPPRWRRMAPDARYAWLDTRALYARQRPPRQVAEGGRRVVLKRWAIPLEAGANRVELRGATSWLPSAESVRREGSGLGGGGLAAVAAAAVFLVALLAAVALRRRARRASRVVAG